MIKLKNLIDERVVYHGTISDFVEKIRQSKKLKSVLAGAQKVSAGYTTETGMIWVTPDLNVAKWYADGVESRNEFNLKKGIKGDFGGIFQLEIPDSLRLINRYAPLNDKQIKILNQKFIPHYKPLNIGDSLLTAEWRIPSSVGLHDLIKALGYDGVVVGKNDIQIGIVASELPVTAFLGKQDQEFQPVSE